MSFILWIIAVVIAIVGIVQLVQGHFILGIALIILACLVGPGGYSIFKSRGSSS
ncbi:MAG: GPGG-motif small membrane protein [Actinomycetota bacterium]|nr:GPGG-motif small membrane protein [Actinomycetota bacterium]